MLLSNALHESIGHVLRTRPILYPRPVQIEFPDGYQPVHLKCYRTARKVQKLLGHPVVAGITFLDRQNKLLPWPHMVNAVGPRLADGLIDASPQPDQANLGFAPIFVHETEMWNEVSMAYSGHPDPAAPEGSWGDANADKLSQEFLSPLRHKASVAWVYSTSMAVPDHIPEADSAAGSK